MTDVNLFRDLDRLPEKFHRGAVSIGNFDGVHRGHAQIIERLVATARRVDGPAVVFTFDPHPARVLRPEAAPTPLGWTERNAQLLTELGVDAVVAYPTDKALLGLDARRFLDRIVRQRLRARAVVEGANFFFGRNRTGTVDLLRRYCDEAGIMLEVVEPVVIQRQVISSSQIRALVAAGRLDQVLTLLGRPYRIRGTVVRGAGRGAGLGYPTANLEQIDTLLPGEGIYAGRALTPSKDPPHPAAISVGPNPTFDEANLKVEAHLIQYDGELHGRTIEVDFLARLRDIKRFGSVDQLTAQMDRDISAARQIAQQYRG